MTQHWDLNTKGEKKVFTLQNEVYFFIVCGVKTNVQIKFLRVETACHGNFSSSSFCFKYLKFVLTLYSCDRSRLLCGYLLQQSIRRFSINFLQIEAALMIRWRLFALCCMVLVFFKSILSANHEYFTTKQNIFIVIKFNIIPNQQIHVHHISLVCIYSLSFIGLCTFAMLNLLFGVCT